MINAGVRSMTPVHVACSLPAMEPLLAVMGSKYSTLLSPPPLAGVGAAPLRAVQSPSARPSLPGTACANIESRQTGTQRTTAHFMPLSAGQFPSCIRSIFLRSCWRRSGFEPLIIKFRGFKLRGGTPPEKNFGYGANYRYNCFLQHIPGVFQPLSPHPILPLSLRILIPKSA